MSDTTALQHVLDGYRADIDRRNALIRAHQDSAAELAAANTIDTAHAEVATALIAQLRADEAAVWAPAEDIQAAALVQSTYLVGGIPNTGKAGAARRLLLAALHDAKRDIAVLDGKAAAGFVHDHGAADCPACVLDGVGSGEVAR